MAADLKELYKKASDCSTYSDFAAYSDFTECLTDLENFKQALPKDYPHYKEAIKAVDASVQRISFQKQIKYSQQSNEAEFIKSRTIHQLYRKIEKESWQELTTVRIEAQNKPESSPFSENFINMLIIGVLLLIIFTYRLIVSNQIGKIKARNILRSFSLMELADLVEKDITHKSNFKISWFGLRTKDENEGTSNLTPEEKERLNLIYQHITILETAFQSDISKNKLNIWKGVDLNNAENKRARTDFLNLIDEKVKE